MTVEQNSIRFSETVNTCITVLWPENEPTGVEEEDFSLGFCRDESRKALEPYSGEGTFMDYGKGETVGEFFPVVKGDAVLIVTDPSAVIACAAMGGLIKNLSGKVSSSAPVYNVTEYPEQAAVLPAPYFTVSSYEEIALLMATEALHLPFSIATPDPCCILVSTACFKALPADTFVIAAASSLPEETRVVPYSMVHRFCYTAEREDLVSLVPPSAKRVLDVGCAGGAYGRRLKEVRPEIFIAGVEMNPVRATAAKRVYDEVHVCPVEEAELSGRFDVVNCGDVLEHLREPWEMLRVFHSLLSPGGCLVTSVPNSGHWSIVKDLLSDRFQYIPLGLLCIGHIRWFTESSFREALEGAGFTIEVFNREQHPPTPGGQAFIDALVAGGYGNRELLLTNEFTVRAVKY